MAALLAGLPVSTPGVTINRLCASGADAVGTAARAVIAGQIDLAIAGGVESMTRAPYIMAKGDKRSAGQCSSRTRRRLAAGQSQDAGPLSYGVYA